VDKAWLRASASSVSPQGMGPPLRQGEGKVAPSTPPVPEQAAGLRAASSPGPEATGSGNTSRGHSGAQLLGHALAHCSGCERC